MKAETRQALIAVNRAFYTARASEFAATRTTGWAGWQRVLTRANPARVLDLGCGHGRLAQELASRPELGCTRYVGVDASPSLLELAARRPWPSWVSFRVWDVTGEALDGLTGPAGYTLVTLFAVLHHVPGASERRTLLADALACLSPGGLLAVSLWHFDEHPRFAGRCHELTTTAPRYGVDPGDLERGDQLLRFGACGPPRYCHFFDADETERLCTLPGARVVERFRPAEGDRLNEYLLLSRV